MASIDIQALSERLSDEEIEELTAGLEQLGAPQLPRAADDTAITIAEGLDEDAVAEFLDRLEASDLACDIYLPMEFEGTVEVGDLRVGSVQTLLEALEEMKDELTAASDEDDEYVDDEEEEPLTAGQLKQVWKLFFEGAQAAADKHLPLHITQ
jgi:hypothetical protein